MPASIVDPDTYSIPSRQTHIQLGTGTSIRDVLTRPTLGKLIALSIFPSSRATTGGASWIADGVLLPKSAGLLKPDMTPKVVREPCRMYMAGGV